MGIGSIIKSTIIPVLAMVIFGLITLTINTVISVIPVLNLLGCITGPIGMFLGLVISVVALVWAGKGAGGVGSGAVSGALAGFASSVIYGIAAFVLSLLGVGVNAATNSDASVAAIAGLGALGGLALSVLGTGFWTISGAVLGAIGGMMGGKK